MEITHAYKNSGIAQAPEHILIHHLPSNLSPIFLNFPGHLLYIYQLFLIPRLQSAPYFFPEGSPALLYLLIVIIPGLSRSPSIQLLKKPFTPRSLIKEMAGATKDRKSINTNSGTRNYADYACQVPYFLPTEYVSRFPLQLYQAFLPPCDKISTYIFTALESLPPKPIGEPSNPSILMAIPSS